MGQIYKISNTVNGKVYIGQTTIGTNKRWKEHLLQAKKSNRTYKSKLYDAMRKYGVEKFYIEVIEDCSNSELDDRERYWIAYYNSMRSGYNLTVGGYGHGDVDDAEVKYIVSLWNSGMTQRAIEEKTGRNHKLISALLYANGVTREEVLERQVSLAKKKGYKPIYAYDMDGNFLKAYGSIQQASKETGIHTTTIGHIASGRDAYSRGMVFRYTKAEKIDPTPYTEHPRKIEVHQYSLNGDYIASYPSYSAGARAVGLAYGNDIKKSCINKTTISGGYQWRNYKADHIDAVAKVTKRSKCKTEF